MLLSSVSLSVPVIINPVITFTNVNVIKNYNIDFYKGNLDETKLILKKYLNNEVTLTSEEIIKVIKNCGINIYRIFEETEYQEFMNQYYMFLDKVKDNIDEIDSYSFECYTKIIDKNSSQIEILNKEIENSQFIKEELNNELITTGSELAASGHLYNWYFERMTLKNSRSLKQKSNELLETRLKDYEKSIELEKNLIY